MIGIAEGPWAYPAAPWRLAPQGSLSGLTGSARLLRSLIQGVRLQNRRLQGTGSTKPAASRMILGAYAYRNLNG
jgi:hypothetical protein